MEGTIARVPILTKKLRLSWFSLVKYGLAYSFSQVIPERLRINHRGRKNKERKTDSSGKTYHLHSSRGCQLVPNSGVEKFKSQKVINNDMQGLIIAPMATVPLPDLHQKSVCSFGNCQNRDVVTH
jgi:hypothetical protein